MLGPAKPGMGDKLFELATAGMTKSNSSDRFIICREDENPDVLAQPGDIMVPKKHWGAFVDTDLEQQLRDRGVRDVVVAGVAAGFGVESTARQASELGFNVIITADAMSDMNAAVHERAVEMVFPAMAQVRTTDAVLAALQQG